MSARGHQAAVSASVQRLLAAEARLRARVWAKPRTDTPAPWGALTHWLGSVRLRHVQQGGVCSLCDMAWPCPDVACALAVAARLELDESAAAGERFPDARTSAVAEERTWDYEVVEVRRVVDGDTYDLTLSKRMDFGFRLTEEKRWSTRFRMLGGDAYETDEKGGAGATASARLWLSNALGAGVLRGQSYKPDDFGRWLLDLYRTDTGEHLNAALRATGWLKPSKWDAS